MASTKRKSKRNKDDPFPSALPALLRAAKRAREVARRFGTPIYVMRNGKIVALKP